MAEPFSVEVKGLSEMISKLDRKIRRLEQRELRKALAEAAKPILNQYQASLNKISPDLNATIDIRMRGHGGTVRVGPAGNDVFRIKARKGWTVTSAMIGYWRELGYDILQRPYHSIRGNPVWRHIGADAMLTRAYEAQKDNAVKILEDTMRPVMEEEIE